MAGDWIKMRIDLQSHPKIVRILSATDSDKFRAIGGLHAVWSIFDTHSEDGVLNGYSAKTLDHVIGWEGFSAAMIAVGWMIETPQGLVMPEFDEHNGKSAKRRAEDQKRKRESRKCPQNVREESFELRTREEKRREEDKSSCDQQAESPKAAPDRIDYASVTKAFGDHLGALPQPRDMTEKRKKAIRSIVKRGGRYAEPDFFARFFAYVAKSDFLMGRGAKPWHGCCFDWLLKPENFQKIIEGNYHPEDDNA
jgi:hypothetical protein